MTTTSTTLTLTPRRRDWRSAAACRGVDPELFFPVAETGPAYDAQVGAAKAVCARCPVVAECLAEALARIPDGICGGLTADERHTLHRTHRDTDRSASAAERAVTGRGGWAA